MLRQVTRGKQCLARALPSNNQQWRPLQEGTALDPAADPRSPRQPARARRELTSSLEIYARRSGLHAQRLSTILCRALAAAARAVRRRRFKVSLWAWKHTRQSLPELPRTSSRQGDYLLWFRRNLMARPTDEPQILDLWSMPDRDLRDFDRGDQPPSWQGSAEGHGRARPCASATAGLLYREYRLKRLVAGVSGYICDKCVTKCVAPPTVRSR